MINLLPSEYKSMIKNARANQTLIRYMLAIIIATTLVIGVITYGMTLVESSAPNLEEQIAKTTQDIDELQDEHNAAKNLSSDINLVAKIIDREIEISQLLNELANVLPPGVVLTNLTLSDDRSGPIKLDFDAVSAESISVAQQNIQEAELFIGAEILLVQAREGGEQLDYDFIGSVNAYFNPDYKLGEDTNE